jgi:hypothetical protein
VSDAVTSLCQLRRNRGASLEVSRGLGAKKRMASRRLSRSLFLTPPFIGHCTPTGLDPALYEHFTCRVTTHPQQSCERNSNSSPSRVTTEELNETTSDSFTASAWVVFRVRRVITALHGLKPTILFVSQNQGGIILSTALRAHNQQLLSKTNNK